MRCILCDAEEVRGWLLGIEMRHFVYRTLNEAGDGGKGLPAVKQGGGFIMLWG